MVPFSHLLSSARTGLGWFLTHPRSFDLKDPLRLFSEPTRRWFSESFAAPTPAQAEAWEKIAKRENALVIAPTGSGKTLAAFLWSIDRLAFKERQPISLPSVRVLYISPLKALAADIERNLKAPLIGIRRVSEMMGTPMSPVSVGIRTGDTPPNERRRFPSSPPDIFITTPESLFLVLTSEARSALSGVETVIVDEVHSIAATKRGSHLAVSLERLDDLLTTPAQRIGLSATVRPAEEVARFLGGERPVKIVSPAFAKSFDISVSVAVEDMSDMGTEVDDFAAMGSAVEPERKTIWPSIEERLLALIRAHRSTIVFTNSRRLSERLSARLNELAEEPVARAHHGSVSKQQRQQIEEDLKAGHLPAVLATSSLELGIDMGAVDLVLQVEAPTSVASGLQRIGRAGHQVGATSRGIIFPKWRGDLVNSAVVVEKMKKGEIESISYPRNPLDVLAQQIVAMVAVEDLTVEKLAATMRRAAPFGGLTDAVLGSVLDMLSGRYPSDEFAELRPRINWDRATNVLSARPGAKRLAVTSGGTIPDRGLFGVFLVGEERVRVGELDEEMVYESRVGDVFALGATSWRIEEITHDRVLVTPAPGQAARMPFWKGDSIGRPKELGRALGAFMREVGAMKTQEALERLEEGGLDDFAANNLVRYLDEQKDATGVLPDDRTIIVERFRDEIGDWRMVIHSPFGARVHAPWTLAIESAVRDRLGLEVQTMYTDDGIVVRLPEADEAPTGSTAVFDPEEIEDLVTSQVGLSALFASRFRECAARALLLPRRDPGRRTPLWQQRQRSASLLQVASGYGSFPIVLEAMRECLQDVFDLPGLVELMTDLRSRKVKMVEVETTTASPFASALLFGYIGAFIYDGDAPLAERRAQALSLDTSLLAELLGKAELRELIDPDALDEVELSVQWLGGGRRIVTVDDLVDALRILGDLSPAECILRGASPHQVEEAKGSRDALVVRIAGEERLISAMDASRFRDALGIPMPVGVPDAFLEPVMDPVGDLVSRYARTHGPFHAEDVAARLGMGVAVVTQTLRRLAGSGRVVVGEFRPGGIGTEWCDSDVLRMLRRKSLARLRNQIEPVPRSAIARFLPQWQGVGGRPAYGPDALWKAIEQLQGVAIPASALEKLVLPARVVDYRPSMLDELCASGEVVWVGAGASGTDDGWVRLFTADNVSQLKPPEEENLTRSALEAREALQQHGAMFFRSIVDALGGMDDTETLRALWELVWSGWVTNDTMAPLRGLAFGVGPRASRSTRRTSRAVGPSRQGPPAAAGRWTLVPHHEDVDETRRIGLTVMQMLGRHGLLTRGAVMSEGSEGGFAAAYRVLKVMEEAGKVRRGYFVEGLGAAQFALPGAVDRLRAPSIDGTPSALVLAATDPANPFGAALPWPHKEQGHRPGRKAGALVVLVDSELVVYVERGGRSLLTFSDDKDVLQPAVDALALAVREGKLGKLSVERSDGESVVAAPIAEVLQAAGFRATPRGLRLSH